MQTLREIAKQARQDKKRRFTNLNKMINHEFLLGCFKLLNKNAATGIDGVSAREYRQNLYGNINNLVERVKAGKYHAKMVRRKSIKKPNGKKRPLGILVVDDKLLQTAVAQIFNAIYEQDFTKASYGYRPNRGAKEAIRDLTNEVREKYSYIVEADIQGFFDHIDHEWLMKMLDLRIGDGPVKKLIWKWLKAKVLEEDGIVKRPIEGTPQGGVISPILANIYLHYVLDLWFEHAIKPKCDGDAYFIRYADDFVALFQYARDAEKYYRELGERLAKFNLALAEDKTRIVSFSRFRKYEKTSFSFLGIEFRWGISNNGKDVIKRRTDRNKLRKANEAITMWCKENRHQRIRKQSEDMKLKLQGHYNYYGIAGNSHCIRKFYDVAMRAWYKWLNRRSQRRSFTWTEFKQMLKEYEIPYPRITEQWRSQPAK